MGHVFLLLSLEYVPSYPYTEIPSCVTKRYIEISLGYASPRQASGLSSWGKITCNQTSHFDLSRTLTVIFTNTTVNQPVSRPEASHTMGSVILPHLHSAWHVDQSILSEDDRLVIIRFGKDGHPDCLRQDDVLAKIADKVKNFAVIYLCDIDEVPDFTPMYELYDPMTIMVCVEMFLIREAGWDMIC